MTAAIDLDDLLSQDTAILEVMKPGGIEPIGWQITMAGPGHPQALAWSKESQRKALRRAQAQEAAQVNGRKYKPEDRDEEQQRRDNVAWVVAHIVDWTPVRLGGSEVEFTPQAATDLLMNPRLGYAFLQMVEFLADERSFTKRSAPTSEPSRSATTA